MRKMVLFGSILALSACEATAEGGAEEATVPSEEVANSEGQTTHTSSSNLINERKNSKKTPPAASWIGKSVDEKVNGFSILQAEDLNSAILKVGGNSLLNQLNRILINFNTEMGGGAVWGYHESESPDASTIVINGCGYRQCGDPTPTLFDQFWIEYYPEWGGVFVCVIENSEINTYSEYGRNIEGAEECTDIEFYYGN